MSEVKSILNLHLAFLVAWRHYQIFRRDLFANISPALADPFLYVVVFGYWLGTNLHPLGERPYLEFMVPGIPVMAALFMAFFEGSYGFFVRLEFEHVFKAMLTTPIRPVDIFAGELIWIGAKAAIMATCVSLVLLAFGAVHAEYAYLIPVLGCLTGISCGAIGLIASCFVRNIHQFQIVYAWVISPMFFVSGMFVSTDTMPKVLYYLNWLSPVFHSVQLAQASLWGEAVVRSWCIHGSFLTAIMLALVLWAGKLVLPRIVG